MNFMRIKLSEKALYLVCLFLLVHSAFSQSYTVETVPNVKLQTNSYVSNPDGLLRESTVNQIDQKLISLEQSTTAQVSVVMLNSIGDEDMTDFAQSLFEKWGIGQASKDNGLLILFVQDQKTIRFHTGFGLEGILPDVICKRIQTQKMVPLFKEGNVDGGMLAGIDEVAKILTDPAYAEEINAAEKPVELAKSGFLIIILALWLVISLIAFFAKLDSGFSNSKNSNKEAPNSKMSSGRWFLFWFVLPFILFVVLPIANSWLVMFCGFYLFFTLAAVAKYLRMNKSANTFIAKGKYRSVFDFYQENKGVLSLVILFPIPFAFLKKQFTNKMNSIRTHPRTCRKCNGTCVKLSEKEENEFLSKAAQYEETLKSVDYDVWKCGQCNDIHLEAYLNEKTKYTPCSMCNTTAARLTNSTTKVAATTSSTGIMIYSYLCKFCKHKSTVEGVIPQIVVSSSSSSSSDSSYSSSDSGGSYGGGDSGGGGASSSW